MISIYIGFVLLLATGFFVLRQVGIISSPQGHDPLEPPLAPTSIPFIGHVIGLSRRKFEYYVDLAQKTNSSIFTVHLTSQKVYVVTTPDLIQAVQKLPKILNFAPIESKFSIALMQPSKQASDVLNQHLSHDDEWGVHVDTRNGMREGTAPGPEVDTMNRAMIKEVAKELDGITPEKGATTPLELFAWLKESLSIATTNAVYGEHNPYLDPEIRKAFWTFENNIISIMLMPKLLVRKPNNARDKVAKAFEEYYTNEHHERASLLTRNRWNVAAKNGISLADTARFEVGGSLAFLVNTIPATFWFLFYIYSHPELLASIRRELDAVIHIDINPTTGDKTYGLDITSTKANCPVMLSAFQETLRLRTMGMSVREVMADTVLAGKFLLKKGSMIQMPMRIIHTSPAVWGDDVDEFRPRRFMKGEKHQTPGGVAPSSVSFRFFGGGKTLCPGRHFATNEIVAVVATFVSRFDMRPRDGGKWKAPTCLGTSAASAVMTPDWDLDVEIMKRDGFEDGRWELSLSDSKLILALTAEDQGRL